MDYFQGVVTEFLREDRATFVNTEFLIQLELGDKPAKGQHWYCDAVAVSFRDKTAYLCEVTYSKSLNALLGRLEAWSSHWPALRSAIARDCLLQQDWRVRPWLFIPEDRNATLERKLPVLVTLGDGLAHMPKPRVTYLESVVPWKYRSWDRKGDATSSDA